MDTPGRKTKVDHATMETLRAIAARGRAQALRIQRARGSSHMLVVAQADAAPYSRDMDPAELVAVTARPRNDRWA